MICKEELCELFKNLSPYKRVDYMCSLLHMCLPLEVRFIGSVLEDYGRKDYYYLRDAEIKANTPHEVSRLTELPEKAISSGLNVYLCLLHSSNLACSKLIFEILDTCLRRAFDFGKSTNPKEHEELLLALSLAVHHPAFTFYQKTILYNYYAKLETHIRDLDKPDKPDDVSFSEDSAQVNPHEEVTADKVVISNIDIRDIKKRPERKAEFRIQITLSNNEQFEITKTPRELQDFQTKLQKLFPNEVDVHKRGWKIPCLHGNTYHTNRDERENPMYTLQQYFSHITDLPQRVLESDHVTQFFRAGHSVKTADNIPVSSTKFIPHPCLKSPDPVIGTYPVKSMIVSNSQYTDLMPDEIGVQLPKCNNQHTCLSTTKGSHHWTGAAEQNRIICSKHGLTTSQHRSPAHSPMSSSTDSPSSSRPSSPMSHNSTVSVTQLLKLLNLEKYSSSLSKFTVEQLASLTSEELSEEGLPKDCQHLLQTKLENITRNKSFASKNGMVELCNPERVLSASTNLIWHATPPNMPYPPMASPVMPCQMVYITSPSVSSPGSDLGSHGMVPGSGHVSDLTSQDLSSECSSTPPSPSQCSTKQQVYAESSGSDDNDKEKVDPEENACRRKDLPLGQSMLNPSMVRGDEMKVTSSPHPTFFLEPKPEFQPLMSGQNGYPCDSAHAPVMSTGYPPARPTYIAMRPYKAPQPTHAHVGLPVKSVVSMPQDGQMKPSSHSIPHVMYPVQPVRSDYPAPASINNNAVKNSNEGLHRTQPFLMGRPLKGTNGSVGWPATSSANSTSSTSAVQSAYHSRQSPGPPPVPANPNSGLPLPPPSVSPPDASLQAVASGMPGLPANSQAATTTSATRAAPSQSPGPPQMPNSSSNNCDCTCGSCECQNNYPSTSAYPQFSIVPPTAFWPLQIPPHLLAQGNGIIAHMPPNMYGQIPPANYPNGVNPEYLFQHHPNFQHLPPGVLPMSYMYGCNMLHNSVNKQRNPGCYNCGAPNHKVQDCKEKTMESFSGFHLNYKPKSDSD